MNGLSSICTIYNYRVLYLRSCCTFFTATRRPEPFTRPVGLKSILVTSPRRFQRRGWLSSALRNLMLIAAWRLGVSPQRLAKLYS